MRTARMQMALFTPFDQATIRPPSGQLLKWIGSKHRFAAEIVAHFPRDYAGYFEQFLGSGAVLATLAPRRGVASDTFPALIEIWRAVAHAPEQLKEWYAERWQETAKDGKQRAYERIKASYNARPNGADLLFLCRACYGGVVRFRKADGYMSTPCGVHEPISPISFNKRVDEWHQRTAGAEVRLADYREAMAEAGEGDLVYCDPPHSYSQSILYGAQAFSLTELFRQVAACKDRGVHVAVSLDGSKKSGGLFCHLEIPPGLFERELEIRCGRSMLRRFQMGGRTLEDEHVSDRLLLTY
jgi:DNA adenine methylase